MVAAGALSPAGTWIRPGRGFLFPVKALSLVFRGKFLTPLAGQFARGRLARSGATAALGEPHAQRALFAALRAKSWVVYAKRPFAGPEQVLQYLGRYTHRVAISNERLVSCEPRAVRFRYRDYASGNRRRVMALAPEEFLRRFALHVLPRGFNRVRHYGLLANRNKRALLERARAALDVPTFTRHTAAPESARAFWQRIAGIDIERCPHCRPGQASPPRHVGPANPSAAVTALRPTLIGASNEAASSRARSPHSRSNTLH